MDRHWRVLESRVTYQDRWLKLRTDRCETPSGKILQGFHVIELPDWINVIGVDRNLDVILVREYRHGVGKLVVGLPSGIVEGSDPSPLEGARREMIEETGFGEGRYFLVGSASPNPAIQNNLAHSYLAVDLQEGFERHLDPGEDIEVIRVPFDRFLRSSLKGDLALQSIHLAAVQMTLGYLLSQREPHLARLRETALRVVQDL
ncbi:MAG TPA: NUDIX hydrolase [Bdellovibrionota bacterium]|nr:NUDIX hydrolase [Bdellovibrionota bacterium]